MSSHHAVEDVAPCRFTPTEKMAHTHGGIGWTQPALDGRRTCTICVPFQSVLGTHQGYVLVANMFPIRTEMVRKCLKQCKYGIRLEQARSVLCLCVRAIFLCPLHEGLKEVGHMVVAADYQGCIKIYVNTEHL